jgi:peptide chain release factor subunit 1
MCTHKIHEENLNVPEMKNMYPNACNKDIKELSSVYDKDGLNTFVSFYFNGNDSKFILHREKAVKSVLVNDELENFVKTMKKIMTYIKKNDGTNIAIFASNKNEYFKAVSLPVKVKNALVVDASPYVRQLAELSDEWKAFTLVLLNTNHAKIFSLSCGEILDEEEMSADIMNKHKKGGWSQARFQRLRKGSIHAFLAEVVDELEKIADEDIIVAGPGQAKSEFLNLLPKKIREGVIAVVDIDINDEYGLLKESFAIMSEKNRKEKDEVLEHLKQEILIEGLAVHGVDETIDAVKNGKAELLLVEEDFKMRGWVCERCQIAGRGLTTTCPNCGNKTSEVDVIEEIIELAERTDVKVEFTDNDEIKKLGHIVALLRYK